jgi:sugar phosphate isomerase/epimerase
VALYPHTWMWVERVQDAVRLAKKVDRDNVGATFNLCHCLKVGDEKKIPALLEEALPKLFVVSINGADREGDWNRLIQPLDAGNVDVAAVLRKLKQLGYAGPIGLQHYGIGGDVRVNLKRSLDGWRKVSADAAAK